MFFEAQVNAKDVGMSFIEPVPTGKASMRISRTPSTADKAESAFHRRTVTRSIRATPGMKPTVPHYEPARPTTAQLEWADLPTVDLSKAGTEDGKAELARVVMDAMEEYGFFYVVNHGLSAEENARIFDIADVPFSCVSDEEKEAYVAQIEKNGSFQGYKPRHYWHISGGVLDQNENYSVNRNVMRREHPEPLRPLLPEIAAFAKHNHITVLHTILRLFARGLSLDEETFVRLHNFDSNGESYVRFMKYYPRPEEEEKVTQQVWLKGHTDIGSVTILWSQPVSALQILGRDKEWRWVVNAGDTMEFLSGGRVKATIHRVNQPPPDQRGVPRLGVFYFAMPDDDVCLAPTVDGASQAEPLTMERWRTARTRAYGRSTLTPNIKETTVEEEIISGVVVRHYN